jgi:hypothetical protein
VLTPTTDNISLPQNVTTRSTLRAAIAETLSIASFISATAAKLKAEVSDTLNIADTNASLRRYIVIIDENITFSDQAVLPKRSFSTPLAKVVPPILPETRGQQYLLFRHYASTYRHVNVFQLSNGTYVQDYPTPENGNANVPYPWITDSPDNRYAFVTYWNGTTEAFTLDPHIKQVFWGGEVSFIDQDTANQMVREHPLYANYMDTINA